MKKVFSSTGLTRLAMLVSLASVLHAVEALIPLPFVTPGARLGLANIVALYAVMTMGLREALTISFLRTLLGSLLSGTFMNVGYYLSTSGALFSTLCMYACKRFLGKSVSAVGVSVVGAVSHNIAQVIAASLLLRQPGVFFYLPYLLFFAVPTGTFVGMITGRVQSSLISWRRRS